MKLTKVLAVVMVVALAFSVLAMTASAKGALVFETTSTMFEEYASDPSSYAGELVNAGGGDRIYTDNGLLFTGRSNDYDSVDLKAESFADGKYIVEVTFAANEPVAFRLANGASPYGNFLDSAEPTTGETLSVELEVKGGKWQTVLLADGKESEQAQIRFQTTGDYATSDYFITSIKVFEADGAAATTDVGAATGSDKASADTGVEGVAAIAGLAIIATSAVVISRKRK